MFNKDFNQIADPSLNKRKIDKSKKIQDKNQRNVAFCKRRRGFLKKAIELSRLCDQNIFMIIHDPEKDKVIQYSSDSSFSFSSVFNILKRMKNTPQGFETFTNDDYDKFELVDFRSLRFTKRDLVSNTAKNLNTEDEFLEEEIKNFDKKEHAPKNKQKRQKIDVSQKLQEQESILLSSQINLQHLLTSLTSVLEATQDNEEKILPKNQNISIEKKSSQITKIFENEKGKKQNLVLNKEIDKQNQRVLKRVLSMDDLKINPLEAENKLIDDQAKEIDNQIQKFREVGSEMTDKVDLFLKQQTIELEQICKYSSGFSEKQEVQNPCLDLTFAFIETHETWKTRHQLSSPMGSIINNYAYWEFTCYNQE